MNDELMRERELIRDELVGNEFVRHELTSETSL